MHLELVIDERGYLRLIAVPAQDLAFVDVHRPASTSRNPMFDHQVSISCCMGIRLPCFSRAEVPSR